MTAPLDLDRLEQARALAARLSDAELTRELRADLASLRPEARRALEEEAARRSKPKTAPILTTAPTLHRPIRRVLGVVGAEYVLGVNLFQELLAGVRDAVGGRSATVEAALRQARVTLLEELAANAARLRADAVVSVSVSLTEWSGQNKSMLVLLATGTAVELESHRPDV